MSALPQANTIQPTDGELLMRFVDGRDETAFRELVERHGGLVQAVCRRVLSSEHDIEDAFQATFLVLVRDAAAIRSRESVASWLFKVAHRVAVRAVVERQKRREQRLVGPVEIPSAELAALDQRQTFEVLAAEMNRLPERYRNAMLVFYLEGRTREDAAEQLDCTDAALKARLARGRRLLRHRLMRQGVTLSLVLGSQAVPSSLAAESVSPALVAGTVAAGAEFAQSGAFGSECSPVTISLAQGTTPMTSLTISKLTLAAGALLAVACLTGVGLSVGRSEIRANPNSAAVANDTNQELDTAMAEFPEAAGASGPSPLTLAMQPSGAAVGAVDAIEATRALRPQEDGRGSRGAGSGYGDYPDDGVGIGGIGQAARNTTRAARPAALDLKQMSEIEKKIEDALTEPTSIDSVDTPLEDVMQYLSELHGIPILLLLNDGGFVSRDTPVACVLSGITLSSVLRILLSPHNLTYVVEDEVLKILDSDEEQYRKESRVYPVHGLIAAGYDLDTLVEVIEQSIGIDKDEGDNIKSLPGLLVITQSQHQHRKTHELLDQLYRAQEATKR
jgi:RNA polymerase sigma factor (sigma-70 family)